MRLQRADRQVRMNQYIIYSHKVTMMSSSSIICSPTSRASSPQPSPNTGSAPPPGSPTTGSQTSRPCWTSSVRLWHLEWHQNHSIEVYTGHQRTMVEDNRFLGVMISSRVPSSTSMMRECRDVLIRSTHDAIWLTILSSPYDWIVLFIDE